MMQNVIIVAGGSGKRMQANTPKQFLKIGGMPILMRTINAFYHFSNSINIILVIPEGQFIHWHKLVEDYNFNLTITLVKGGASRFESVKNGLQLLNEEGLVAIHDGVRPFVTSQIISQCFKSAEEYGSGVAAVIPKDSLREISDGSNKGADRNQYRIIQTPQTFGLSIIKQAYMATKDKGFTDDATVVENNGHKIFLVEGDYANIKITTPDDLKIAQALLEIETN